MPKKQEKKKPAKRANRFSNYKSASEREFKKYVNPDGTPISRDVIEFQLAIGKLNKTKFS